MPKLASNSYFSQHVKTRRADIILLIIGFACAFCLICRALPRYFLTDWFCSDIAAAVDCVTVPYYGAFVANSTGNLVFLALGVVGLSSRYPEIVRIPENVTSLCGSWAGAFCVGYLGRYFGYDERGFLFGENVFEALLIYICAICMYCGKISSTNNSDLAVIFLASYAFAAQGVVTKRLNVKGIPMPAVVTGSMNDLFSDPNFLSPSLKHTERNQRVAFLLVFFFGACIGGIVLRWLNGATVLIFVASAKLIAACCFLVVHGENVDKAPKKENGLGNKTDIPLSSMSGSDVKVARQTGA